MSVRTGASALRIVRKNHPESSAPPPTNGHHSTRAARLGKKGTCHLLSRRKLKTRAPCSTVGLSVIMEG